MAKNLFVEDLIITDKKKLNEIAQALKQPIDKNIRPKQPTQLQKMQVCYGVNKIKTDMIKKGREKLSTFLCLGLLVCVYEILLDYAQSLVCNAKLVLVCSIEVDDFNIKFGWVSGYINATNKASFDYDGNFLLCHG